MILYFKATDVTVILLYANGAGSFGKIASLEQKTQTVGWSKLN